MRRTIATIVFALVILPGAVHAEIAGRPRIVDGDTIAFGHQRVRLYGIDAPEHEQSCTAAGRSWRCGQDATAALVRIIGAQPVYCSERDRDQYGRIVAVCHLTSVGGPDINAEIVREGWALAYRHYSMAYVGEEAAARQAKAGIWRGDFVPPWVWRHSQHAPAANDNHPGHCLIKGNINSRGEHIYHVPGGRYYARTRIDPSRGERWFCSEAEARAAGWRRSLR